jgi:ribosomal protein S6
MTLPAPTYDLVLMLDTQAEETTRAKIVADASKAIEAQGELLRHDEWGDRVLAYPIDHKLSAEYHLLQFHARAARHPEPHTADRRRCRALPGRQARAGHPGRPGHARPGGSRPA